MITRLSDRTGAGRLLAAALLSHAREPGLVVLALPRGGVPVGHAVAEALAAPLDVLLVRKLGVPCQPELALGAIASGGARVLNPDIVAGMGLDDAVIARVTAAEQRELLRRERVYRRNRPALPVRDHPVILVDDGIATGATVRVAIEALRRAQSGRIIVAAPVIAREAYVALRREAEEVVTLCLPKHFQSVGEWYDDFTQVTDRQVQSLLADAAVRHTTR
jgi:putative phosphoribosyl transferase